MLKIIKLVFLMLIASYLIFFLMMEFKKSHKINMFWITIDVLFLTATLLFIRKLLIKII
ncbi:hypothetical protein IE3_05609 [Bacillus cereus BAG3X2-1]|nr:hypothetical protein IE3_05609 [Bacillus cereus BAG3X2-1]